jgi:hypothetical protein
MAKKTQETAQNQAETGGNPKMTVLEGIAEEVQSLLNEFVKEENVDSALSGKERLRLIGAGVKNYGLIDKAYDIARDNPQFMPPFLTPQEMWNDMHDFEGARQLVMVLEKFLQLATECMMLKGDKCFRVVSC